MARSYPSGGPQQVSEQDVLGELYGRSTRQRRRALEAALKRRRRKRKKAARREAAREMRGQRYD